MSGHFNKISLLLRKGVNVDIGAYSDSSNSKNLAVTLLSEVAVLIARWLSDGVLVKVDRKKPDQLENYYNLSLQSLIYLNVVKCPQLVCPPVVRFRHVNKVTIIIPHVFCQLT